MSKREFGVSPVIATVLMVSITVVLAATVYIMVSGVMSGGAYQTQISGNLVYRSNLSNRTSGNVTFEIVLSAPATAKMGDIHVKLLNKTGAPVTGFNYTWKHLASNNTYIKGGDLLKISVPNINLTGYQVIIYITGYRGTIIGIVPPS